MKHKINEGEVIILSIQEKNGGFWDFLDALASLDLKL